MILIRIGLQLFAGRRPPVPIDTLRKYIPGSSGVLILIF